MNLSESFIFVNKLAARAASLGDVTFRGLFLTLAVLAEPPLVGCASTPLEQEQEPEICAFGFWLS